MIKLAQILTLRPSRRLTWLITELTLLYGMDIITKPIWHETSNETFGLLDFLILGVRLSDS